MKKYFILFFLLISISLWASDPTGVIKGYDATNQTYIPIAISASGTLPAGYPNRYSNRPTGAAMGWCESLGKYLPIPVASNGGLLLDGGGLPTDASNGDTIFYDSDSNSWVAEQPDNNGNIVLWATGLPSDISGYVAFSDVATTTETDLDVAVDDSGVYKVAGQHLTATGSPYLSTLQEGLVVVYVDMKADLKQVRVQPTIWEYQDDGTTVEIATSTTTWKPPTSFAEHEFYIDVANGYIFKNKASRVFVALYAKSLDGNSHTITTHVGGQLGARTHLPVDSRVFARLNGNSQEDFSASNFIIPGDGQIKVKDEDSYITLNKYGGLIHAFGSKIVQYDTSNFEIVPNFSLNSGKYCQWKYTNCSLSANTTDLALQLFTDSTERMRITKDGNVCIGTTVDDGINKLQVSGDSSFNGNIHNNIAGIILNYIGERNQGIALKNNSNLRWYIYKDDFSETGSNIGTNLRISRYADDGSYLGKCFSIQRSTGNIIIATETFRTESEALQVNGLAYVKDGITSDLHTPASATDTGTKGTIEWDADYIYICVDTDTWKRVAISSW